MTEKLPLDAQDRDWFAVLRNEVWKTHRDSRSGIRWGEALRELTETEIEKIWRLVELHGLPCVMINTAFGFDVGVVVYDHAPVPEIKPEALIAISGDHLPGGKSAPNGRKFGENFDYFSRFTHTDDNRQILDFYGFEEPKSKGHYDY